MSSNPTRAEVPSQDFTHLQERMIIFIPIIAVVSLFHLASTGLFWYRGRTSRDLQRRSVPLVVVTGLAAFLVCALYLSRNMPYVPCTVAHIGSYFGFYYVHTALFARSLRLIAMAQSARAKVRRLLHPEGPREFWERHDRVARILIDDHRLLGYMFLLSSPLTIFAIVALIVSPEYGLLADHLECPLRWEGIPVICVSCLYVLVIFPGLIYFMRHIRDAYAMRNDLIVTCCTSLVFDVFFLVCNFLPPQTLYPLSPLVLPTISVVVIQISSVFLPWLGAERQARRTRGQPFAHTHATFYHVMNDPDLASLFCKFCEHNFCAELPFFLMDYQRLKALCVQNVRDRKPSMRLTTPVLFLAKRPTPRLPAFCTSIIVSPSGIHATPAPTTATTGQTVPTTVPVARNSFDQVLDPTATPTDTWSLDNRRDGPLTGISIWCATLQPPHDSPPPSLFTFEGNHLASLLTQGATVPGSSGPPVCQVTPLPEPIVADLGSIGESTVPADLVIDFYRLYERYFTHDSAWEVNVHGRTVARLCNLVSAERYTWTMFDVAREEVAQLLMEDVFAKFLRVNHELVGAPG
ncbi:hypothetical protein IWQ60_007674 [Tieghemiomyces parasiticus]|uniref:RGS domain-containing protein n=1 Tax=Tieghemiomyces parasiticus TaxID=78921 RepID=A0A9W7ZW33_9FUNG|nr:hypothetical protein IWQ60_007674 [Tieghemiomyces parasiticus]